MDSQKIIIKERKGTSTDPYVYKDESLVVDQSGFLFLTEYPDELYRVEAYMEDGVELYETQEDILKQNEFRVDYESRKITFNKALIGQQIEVQYKGTGQDLLPATSIYTNLNEDGTIETLDGYIKTLNKLINSIDSILDKGSVQEIAGKTGIVTNNDIHEIETILEANSGNNITNIPLGITYFPLTKQIQGYPISKGIVLNIKNSDTINIQIAFSITDGKSYTRKWDGSWSDWEEIASEKSLQNLFYELLRMDKSSAQIIGRKINDVSGLNSSIDLGGQIGQDRLSDADYQLDFTAKTDGIITSLKLPVNDIGSATIVLSKVNTDGSLSEQYSKSAFLQPSNKKHITSFPIKKDTQYRLSIKNLTTKILFEKDVDYSIYNGEIISGVKIYLGNNSLTKGYGYFYDIEFLYDFDHNELLNARTTFLATKKLCGSLNERLDADFGQVKTLLDNLGKQLGDANTSIKNLQDLENHFEPKSDPMNYLLTLQANDAHVMQHFLVGTGKDIFQTQALPDDNYVLSHKNQNGEEVSTSIIEKGGHGTQIAWASSYFYSNMRDGNGDFKLVRFKYKPSGIVKFTDTDTQEVFTGKSNKGLYVCPVIDTVKDIIVFRIGTGSDTPIRIEIRKLTEVLNKVDNILYSFTIPNSLSNSTQPMQGVTYDADSKVLYWLTGTSVPTENNYLTAFDVTGKQLWQRTLSLSTYYTSGNFMEPEGLQLWRSPSTGKKALLIGYSTGLANDRKHMLFGMFQRGVLEELKGAQFGSSGRVEALYVDATKLSQITKVGSYYLTTSQANKLTDFPIPLIQSSGWYLEVTPKSGANGNMRQILTRNSYARTTIQLDRSIDPKNKNYGLWNLTTKYSEGVDRPPTAIKKLTDLAYPGLEWYMTSEDSERMTDFPRKDGVAGWFITHSNISADDVVLQEVKRNATTHAMEIYSRTINIKTKKAGAWSIFKSELV